MKSNLFASCLSVFALCLFGCGGAQPDTLIKDFDEAEMEAAVQKAQSTVDDFIVVLKSGNADSFSVKAPIADANGTEHFWISDVTFDGSSFTGMVNNDPGIVETVKYGDSHTLGKSEISDWMFTRGEKIHGGFTIDPLLSTLPKADADAMRETCALMIHPPLAKCLAGMPVRRT